MDLPKFFRMICLVRFMIINYDQFHSINSISFQSSQYSFRVFRISCCFMRLVPRSSYFDTSSTFSGYFALVGISIGSELAINLNRLFLRQYDFLKKGATELSCYGVQQSSTTSSLSLSSLASCLELEPIKPFFLAAFLSLPMPLQTRQAHRFWQEQQIQVSGLYMASWKLVSNLSRMQPMQYFLLHLLMQHLGSGGWVADDQQYLNLQMWHSSMGSCGSVGWGYILYNPCCLILWEQQHLQQGAGGVWVFVICASTINNHNQMNKILYLLIVATCLSTLAHSQNDIYNSTFGRTISGGTVLDIEYSPDQMYIALIMNNQVILHDGVTALPKYYVPYSTNFLYSSFSFSQDSNLFAVGFVSTDGSNFVKMFTPRKAQQLMTIRLPVGDNAAITVKSLCFTADNSRLIYSTSQGEIFAYKISERTSKSIKFGDIPASTIACSPTRSLQFAAGGSNTDGKQSKLSLYNINPVDNTILPAVHDFVLSDLDETVTSITYSGSGTYLYRSGSKQVYRNNVNEPYAEEIIIATKDELKDFVKIRVTQKDDVLGVSTKLKQLHLVKFVPDANARVEQTLMMSIPGFGLSPNSLNLMYMTSGVTAQVSSQCKTTQILNPDGTCVDCNNNCQMCLDSVNTCRSCYTSFYLSETTNKCESCVARCKGCLDGKSCVICADPFVLSSTKQCVCGSGKYINGNTCSACKQNCRSCTSDTTCSVCQGGYFAEENTCKTCAEGCLSCSDLKTCTTCTEDYELENGVCETKGFPTWAIILLVVLALSVVIIVAGVVYIKMRKQKRSPLLTDSDEAASNLE